MGRANQIKLILILAVFILGSLILSSSIFAQSSYIVEPFLVIPSDWRSKINADTETRYKQNILKGLEESRQLYSSKLGGHTFIYDSNIKVINASLPLGDITGYGCVVWVLDKLNIPKYALDSKKVTNIYFIVGSSNVASCAISEGKDLKDASTYDFRVAALNHNHLENLGDSDNGVVRHGVGVISHELGHAFGLSWNGFAFGHTCSIINKNDCRKDIPGLGTSVPYPPASDCMNSVMGIGYCKVDLVNMGFANSEWNPEIRSLFKGPFINPNGESAPPLISVAPAIPGKITKISPNPVIDRSELVITGSGFGQNKGGIWAAAVNNDNKLGFGYNLTSWTDSEIKIVPFLFYNYDTKWLLSVSTESGERIELSNEIIVKLNPNITYAPINIPAPVPTYVPNATPIPSLTPTPTVVPSPNQTFSPTPIASVIPSPSPASTANPVESSTPLPPQTTPPSISTTPTVTPLQDVQVFQIRISNYNDFRDNIYGDEGSSTQIFSDKSTKILWKKSTLNPNNPIYIERVLGPDASEILEVFPANGVPFQQDGFTIEAKVVRKIVKIQIGSRELSSDFTQVVPLSLHELGGIEGQSGTFPVPVTITYNDGSTKSLPFIFNYNPASTQVSPTPTPASSVQAPATCDPNDPSDDWEYTCGCTSTEDNIPEGGHIAVCKKNPQQDIFCYSNAIHPGSGCTTPTPAPTPVEQTTSPSSSTSSSGFSKTGSCWTDPNYDSNICEKTPPEGAGGRCNYLGQQSAPFTCRKTCPDGHIAFGTSVSTCGEDGCYANSCICNANCNLE